MLRLQARRVGQYVTQLTQVTKAELEPNNARLLSSAGRDARTVSRQMGMAVNEALQLHQPRIPLTTSGRYPDADQLGELSALFPNLSVRRNQ